MDKNYLSDKALTCPHCGNPIKEVKPVPIEITKKKWKKIQLLAVLIAFIGAFFLIKGFFGTFNSGKTWNITETFGFIVIIIAVIVMIVAKIGAWWDNR